MKNFEKIVAVITAVISILTTLVTLVNAVSTTATSIIDNGKTIKKQLIKSAEKEVDKGAA